MPWRACLISIFALGVWMALGATRPALCAADDSTGLAASEQAASSDLGAVSPSAGALGGDLSLPPDDLGLALRQPWTWPQLLQRIWLGWLVAIGAATGSFLNVVIYRAPRGQSLSFPPSRCPQCLHPIRPWHNVPVLGWLWLRGKCHDCGAAISARYPLVEALVAALFGALGIFEAFSAGKNLPSSATLFAPGPLASPDAPAVWYVVAYHAWLWCALVAAALIAWDRQRLPGVLFWPTLAVALAGPTFIAGLHPVAAGLAGQVSGPAWVGRAISPAIGAAIAAGIALALAWLTTPRAVDRWTRYAPLVWVGGFLGWQSASVLAAAAGLAYLLTGFLTSLLAGGRAPWSAALAVATIAWTLAWGQIVEQAPRLLGEEAPWALAALGLAVSVALVWIADRLFTRGAHSAP